MPAVYLVVSPPNIKKSQTVPSGRSFNWQVFSWMFVQHLNEFQHVFPAVIPSDTQTGFYTLQLTL